MFKEAPTEYLSCLYNRYLELKTIGKTDSQLNFEIGYIMQELLKRNINPNMVIK